MLFEKISALQPELKLGDKSDLAMGLFTVVKQWAHDGESVKKIAGED